MLTAIDHIVLTVRNMEKTISFYCNVLGMTLEKFNPPNEDEVRNSLKFGVQKINLHNASSPYNPHANRPLPGTGDTCFLSSIPLDQWHKHFIKHNVQIEEGPIKKTGATGPIMSIYVRDPDLNLIEISKKL